MFFRSMLGVAILVSLNSISVAADPSYEKDVKPFLTKYCIECHGAKQAKAGYNFDDFAGLTKAGKKGAAVVPEKPEKSLLVLTMTGGAKMMPPKKSAKKPTKEEIDVIRDWIKAGGKNDGK